MDVKEKITSKFNKSEFELLDCNGSNNNWSCIDNYIVDFVKKLNQNKHISTLFSCEGHKEEDYSYLFFVVDKDGWDIFWQKVLPEITYEFSRTSEKNNYIVNFKISLQDLETTGINIGTMLCSIPELNLSWKDKKERFWSTINEAFLKYYN